jgi:hypothetical protein
MKDIIDRLVKQRYNKQLLVSVLKSTNNGRMSKDSLKIVERWSYVLFVTFLIKLCARYYYLFIASNSSIPSLLQNSWYKLIFWFLAYGLFLDTLLGIGYHDSLLKTRSNKYVKTLFFIIVYLIGDLLSISYFMGYYYFHQMSAFLALVSCILIAIAYIIIFLCVLDFILYSTDNSDDPSVNDGKHFDFL